MGRPRRDPGAGAGAEVGGDQAGRTPQPQGTAGGGWRWPSTRESGPFKSDPGACWGDAGATSRLGIGLWEEERAPPGCMSGRPGASVLGLQVHVVWGPARLRPCPEGVPATRPGAPPGPQGASRPGGTTVDLPRSRRSCPGPWRSPSPDTTACQVKATSQGAGLPGWGGGASARGRQVYPTWLLAVGLSPGRPPAPRCPPGAGAGTSGPRLSTGLPRPLSRPLLWTSGGGRA